MPPCPSTNLANGHSSRPRSLQRLLRSSISTLLSSQRSPSRRTILRCVRALTARHILTRSQIHVFRLPSSLEEGDKIAPEYLTTLPTSTPANQVRFHPHADGLLLALTGSTVNIYDVNVSSPSYTTEATAKGLCSAAWSSDGRTIVSTGKDGSIALWDLRASSRAVTVRYVSLLKIHADTRTGSYRTSRHQGLARRFHRRATFHDWLQQGTKALSD